MPILRRTCGWGTLLEDYVANICSAWGHAAFVCMATGQGIHDVSKICTEPVVLSQIPMSPAAAGVCHTLEEAAVARGLWHCWAWQLGTDPGVWGHVSSVCMTAGLGWHASLKFFVLSSGQRPACLEWMSPPETCGQGTLLGG